LRFSEESDIEWPTEVGNPRERWGCKARMRAVQRRI